MKLNNNKGFTLILVLLVIAILSILGTTLIGMTIANYKMKLVNTKAKQSFYLSEAGLEESYAKVYNLINDSLVVANSSVEDFLDDFSYEQEIQNELDGIDSLYIDENGQIDEDYLQDKMNHVFKLEFESNIKGLIKDTIENTDEYHKEYDSIEVLESSPKFKNEIMELTIKSTYSVDDVKRKSQVDLVITTPDYNGSYYAEYDGSDSIKVKYNDVWSNVMLADKKISFDTGINNIYGNIKAKDIIFKYDYNTIYGNIEAKKLEFNSGTNNIEDDIIAEEVKFNSGYNTINDNIKAEKIELKKWGVHYLNGINTVDKKINVQKKATYYIEEEIISNVNLSLDDKLVENNIDFNLGDFTHYNERGDEIIYIGNKRENGSGHAYGNNKAEKLILLGENASAYELSKKNKKAEIINMDEYDTYKGLIICEKNIYILGNINFYGAIVSKENIYIYSDDIYSYPDYACNLYYDESFIANAINDYKLFDYFINNDSDYFITSGDTDINFSSDLTFNNQKPEDILEFRNWEITY